MEFDGSLAALLAIDPQRAFCPPEGSVARQGRDVSSFEAISFGFGRVISHDEALSALAAGRADL